MKSKNGINIICQACAKQFYVPAYRINTAKFCSIDCQNHKQYKKYIFNCNSCQKKVITSPSRKNYKKKYCSIECREYKRKNEKERRAQRKALNILKRGYNSSRNLRKSVFLFKEKKCQICGYNEYEFCLDLHHIDKDCTNNHIDNIAILCVMCHRKLHKRIIDL